MHDLLPPPQRLVNAHSPRRCPIPKEQLERAITRTPNDTGNLGNAAPERHICACGARRTDRRFRAAPRQYGSRTATTLAMVAGARTTHQNTHTERHIVERLETRHIGTFVCVVAIGTGNLGGCSSPSPSV
jgi:hypothetical protein